MLYDTITLYYTALYYSALYCTILLLCYTTILCYAIQYYAVLYFTQLGPNARSSKGVCSIKGRFHPDNIPGGRYRAVGWITNTNRVMMFGGRGYDVDGLSGPLSDLWEYGILNNEWKWLSGG